jgi:hypothetical protein
VVLSGDTGAEHASPLMSNASGGLQPFIRPLRVLERAADQQQFRQRELSIWLGWNAFFFVGAGATVCACPGASTALAASRAEAQAQPAFPAQPGPTPPIPLYSQQAVDIYIYSRLAWI